MEIIGAVFKKTKTYGDFGWMLANPEYDDALFVFNDNERQFEAFVANPTAEHGLGCDVGGGNAAIRPWRCKPIPRAAGIPTGNDQGGYQRLDDAVRAIIDEAIGVIRDLLATGRYRRVYFSATPNDPALLGTGIFDVGEDVRRYVVDSLKALAAN